MTIAECVEEILKLCASRGMDMSFFITTAVRHIQSREELADFYGFPPPEPLYELYSVGVLPSAAWSTISFIEVSQVKSYIGWYNQELAEIKTLVKVPEGVRAPVRFGPEMVPFAAYGESLYCIDCNPDLEHNGNLHQIVSISTHSGKVKIAAPSMVDFLKSGIKKIHKDIKKEETEAAAAPSLAEMEAMLRRPLSSLLPPPIEFPQVSTADAIKAATEILRRNPRQDAIQDACARLIQMYLDRGSQKRYGDLAFAERLVDCEPGLSAAAIKRYEKQLGVVFPEDLRSFLRANAAICSEVEQWEAFGVGENDAEVCQDINAVIEDAFSAEEEWRLWPGTRAPVLGKNLILLGGDEPKLCYDLNPGEGGVVGQLVSVDIECATCKVEYPSLLALLEHSIREMEAK
jgi:cell wall assembly regulator SMI1